jgi:hypothetical protein
MQPQRSWPIRYAVTLHPGTGADAVSYTVLTWLYKDKAVALAVQAFSREHEGVAIYDVDVQEVGPAGRTDDGLVDVGADVHDRREF